MLPEQMNAKTVNLRPSLKNIFGLAGGLWLLCCAFTIASIFVIIDCIFHHGGGYLYTKAISPIVVIIAPIALIFFGYGSILFGALLIFGGGHIKVQRDGIILNTVWTRGFIPWSNLRRIAVVTFGTMQHCGIELNDVEAYAKTKSDISGEGISVAASINNLFIKLMHLIAKIFSNIPILGRWIKGKITRKFDASEDVLNTSLNSMPSGDIQKMESKHKLSGFHIGIPAMFITDSNDLISMIEDAKLRYTA
jgi:hypothetical protein